MKKALKHWEKISLLGLFLLFTIGLVSIGIGSLTVEARNSAQTSPSSQEEINNGIINNNNYDDNSVTTSINAGPTPSRANVDFNGDGRSDYVITRNENSLLNWWVAFNGSTTFSSFQWGVATDIATPADFDGDGTTDFAVWRDEPGNPNRATFYILRSSTSTIQIEQFGRTGDNPRIVGDYDGDRKADVAVYREGVSGGQSFFFYRPSSMPGSDFIPVPFGVTGDKAVAGDYDGDGRADVCVARNIGGRNIFIYLRSSDGVDRYVDWGLSSDVIVPGDYDGDRSSDFCVVRTMNGQLLWYILEADGGGTGAGAINWGLAGDVLTPGDYDGDGKQDIAVWRPGAGANTFYVRRSGNNTLQSFNWGVQTDNPIANWRVVPPRIPPVPTPTPTATPTPTPTATPTPTPTFTTFSGRAISLTGIVSGMSGILNDTGNLPSNGGLITRSLPSGSLFGGTLTTTNLDATTQAAFDQSRSQAIVENLSFMVNGELITSSLIPVSSQCTCPAANTPPQCAGGVMIDNLRINGTFITISGINQTVNLPNGGQMIINEQIQTASGNSGTLTVNGVHVIIPGEADVISSKAESGIFCGSGTPTPTPTPTPTTFSGRATSVSGTVMGMSGILNDTGNLPSNGGLITRSLPSGSLFGGTLTTTNLDATTQAAFDQSRSQAIVENLSFMVNGELITSSLIPVSSQCTCPAANTPPQCAGGVMIDNLRINGTFITISGINQTVNLPNGGQMIINEQIQTASGNSGTLTVNGVHVIIPGIADVILSKAESGIFCGGNVSPQREK